MKCPVCDEEMELRQDYMEHVLMEEWASCENCGLYSYEYVTGGTAHHLAPFPGEYATYSHSYLPDTSARHKLEKLIYKAKLNVTRRWWRAGLLGGKE